MIKSTWHLVTWRTGASKGPEKVEDLAVRSSFQAQKPLRGPFFGGFKTPRSLREALLAPAWSQRSLEGYR